MAFSHPYKSAPDSSFWSRAVTRNWNASDLLQLGSNRFLIHQCDRVVSAGSCFAANIIPYLEKSGLKYLKTETEHPAFEGLPPEALGYANFSAAYGNIYTARQLLQLLKRCLNSFSPVEDRWVVGDEIVDSLRPGLRYRARSHREFDILTAQHLRKTHEAFVNADVFIFTLGLTEAWLSRIDGTVFPACPGTVAGCFDAERHEFKNFSAAEVVADLSEFIQLVREINPDVRIIVTVSPVPLVATATGNHVLNSTIYSKAVLRVAAEEITKCHADVIYFPAYEIVTGPQAPWEFYEEDRRSVSQAGIETVMDALLACCEVTTEVQHVGVMEQPAGSENANRGVAAELSRMIAEAECEEAMADSALFAGVSTEQSAEAEGSVIATELSQPCAVAVEADIEIAAEEAVTGLPAPLPASSEPLDSGEVPDPRLDELREQCAGLAAVLAAERADFGRELERMAIERNAVAAESARWFEAAIAITADHNPLVERAFRGRARWWRNLRRRIGGNRYWSVSPRTLADRASAAGQWELAVRYYRDALDLEPNEPRIWVQCGYALRAAGKISEADVAFRKGLEHSGSRLPSDVPPEQSALRHRDA